MFVIFIRKCTVFSVNRCFILRFFSVNRYLIHEKSLSLLLKVAICIYMKEKTGGSLPMIAVECLSF